MVCAIHGNDALIVAAVSLTPGRISFENALSGGNAWFRCRNVLLAVVSTPGSRRMVVCSAVAWLANAAIVVLKFVTRSLSASSWRASIAAV